MSSPRLEAETRIRELSESVGIYKYKWEDFKDLAAARRILAGTPELKRAVVLVTAELINSIWAKWEASSEWGKLWFGKMVEGRTLPRAAMAISRKLLLQDLEYPERELVLLLETTARIHQLSTSQPFLEPLVKTAEEFVAKNGMSPPLRSALKQLRSAIYWDNAPERKLKDRIKLILERQRVTPESPLLPGEAWSDAALADLKAMGEEERYRWQLLLAHCQGAKGGSPDPKWLKGAGMLVTDVGLGHFKSRVQAWFPLVNEPRTQPVRIWSREYQPDPNQLILPPHADLLKGLAWCCGLNEDKELARALTALAVGAYRKIPLKGPREVKVGNACVTGLGMMPGMEGVYQLALLKVKVKFGTAQKFIEAALNSTAERVGIPRDELEEMAVPGYGLTGVGVAEEKLGDFTARLTVCGSTATELTWIRPDGKVQSGVPSAIKESFGEDLKELRASAKDIQKMLPAQRERLDSLFLQQRTWPVGTWRERYLDHPLVGVLARRLLWDFALGERTVTAVWFRTGLVDLDLKPVPLDSASAVQLWHPIGKSIDEITAWRSWLDAQQIQQPFKQAHREIYLLTDAERQTQVYSNRHAAHVLKQHQFNALCALRGWKNKLRLMVDAEYPPATLTLPRWGLRAEFWIEGLGEDYTSDVNESGVFLYVSTDQVRFYKSDSAQRTAHAGGGGYHASYQEADPEPMPLEQIPALVFSEVMRDVDLFVGVASVGNDPAWSDGGPDGRYRDYWQHYSFGELNASAKTRKEVLQKLVPRLKIASQCSFQEKFLVIKGGLRTYKIHLGSGNVLMAPNDQYLCIVPSQSQRPDGDLFLPFEGDRTLSIILSKAFLLAADTQIQDSSIRGQIRR